MNNSDIALFWNRLAAINPGFLEAKSGAARLVPMSHTLRDDDGTIRFIMARDTDLTEAVENTSATYVVADGERGLHDTIHTKLSTSRVSL